MLIIIFILLLFGILFHSNNFILLAMILELLFLLLSLLLISLHLHIFAIISLAITASETAIGLSILLGYYIRSLNTI